MNLLKDICGTFCDGLGMREVPMGYAIKTPFKNPDGDAVAIYARRSKDFPGLVRLEDDGATVVNLQEEGFGLDNDVRHAEFQRLLAEHGCVLDEVESLVHTEYMDETRIAAQFLKFMSLMVRVSDLRLLSRERVRDTFKADLQALVQETFMGLATVELDKAPQDTLREYIPDAVVYAPKVTLAVYAGTGEVKALEAFVLWQELLRQRISNVIPFIVFEAAKPPQLKARTFSRIINSDVVMATTEGSSWDVTQKLRKTAQVETLH